MLSVRLRYTCTTCLPARSPVLVTLRLAGFAAVTLEAGASALVELALPARAFANWADGWQYEPGTFAVHVGTSVTQTPLEGSVTLTRS